MQHVGRVSLLALLLSFTGCRSKPGEPAGPRLDRFDGHQLGESFKDFNATEHSRLEGSGGRTLLRFSGLWG